MSFGTTMYNPRPAPEPDFADGMTKMQMAVSNSTPLSRGETPPLGASGRARPSIPQKKNHIDELVRLRRELEDERYAKEQANEVRDAIAADLIKREEEISHKDEVIQTMTQELSTLREKDHDFQKMSNEIWTLREKADRLTAQLAEERRVSMQTTRPSTDAGTMSPVLTGILEAKDAELTQLRQQVHYLSTSLAESENNWSSQLAGQQKLLQAAQRSLDTTRDYYERRLADVGTEANSRIAEQTQRLQEMEATLQNQKGRMDVDSVDHAEVQHLQQLLAESQRAVEEQRRCAEQFRKMSERLTTQVKEAKATMPGRF